MEENLKRTIEYLKGRIRGLKDIEEDQGGWNFYDEGDIFLSTELATLEKVLKMLEGS